MIQFWSKFYHNYIKPYLFGDEEHISTWDADTGRLRHQKSICDAGANLQNEALPLRKRLEAAHDLGVMGYTGGYEAAIVAADYMPTIVKLLTTHDLCEEHLIILLKVLSTLCYAHLRNQMQASSLGLMSFLPTLLTPTGPHSALVKRWTCYLLDILCCNNAPAMRKLQRVQDLKANLEDLEAENWTGWPKNYAEVLLRVLAYKPSEPNLEDNRDEFEEDDSGCATAHKQNDEEGHN